MTSANDARNQVGADVGALCRKCGDVWHVVVAVVSGRVVQVECKQCGGRHRFRPVPGSGVATARGANQSARTSAATRSGTSRSRSVATLIEADPTRAPRNYAPADSYTAGDRIVHPRFGEGVVQAVTGQLKVSVHFTDGSRTLVQGRALKS